MKICTTCHEESDDVFTVCWKCGAPFDITTTQDGQSDEVEHEPEDEPHAMSPETDAWESVLLTTAPSLEGWNVTTTHDVIASECALGMGLIGDLFAAGTNALGGRSAATERVLREARTACLSDLRRTAHTLGANAVIAVRLTYTECSGSILLVVASGTAVSVSPSSVPPRRP